MSRYTFETEREGVRYHVAFGYDNPLSEYFIHVSYADPKDMLGEPSTENPEPELLFAVSSYNTLKCHPDYPGKTKWSRGELLELFEAWNCPPLACQALAGDLPF
jgi:hypothetical protein